MKPSKLFCCEVAFALDDDSDGDDVDDDERNGSLTDEVGVGGAVVAVAVVDDEEDGAETADDANVVAVNGAVAARWRGDESVAVVVGVADDVEFVAFEF